MRKRKLRADGLLLFLSAALLAHASSGYPGKTPEQGQPERPKSYAFSVVCENKVKNAKDSLGAPDSCNAEILPSGQLVLLMAKQMRNMVRVDIQKGGGGLEFMIALAFINGKVPDLQYLKNHMIQGFNEQELAGLSSKLGLPLDPEQNKWGELKEISAAFKNNFGA